MTTQAAVSGHQVEHEDPNYIAIFIYLAVLTGVELVVYAVGLPQVAKVGLLIALAFTMGNLLVALRLRGATALRAVGIRRRTLFSGAGLAGAAASVLISLVLMPVVILASVVAFVITEWLPPRRA